MPIFEYTCHACGHRFEHLTRADREAACPACESRTLGKELSTFAVGANSVAHDAAHAGPRAQVSAPRPCGSCGDLRGPGACSMN